MAIFSKSQGGNILMLTGFLVLALSLMPLVVDVPTYLTVQQQLQNAVDAAALAGAAKLPSGITAAEQEAYAVASQTLVGGNTLKSTDLTYTYNGSTLQVSSTLQSPTLTASMICAVANAFQIPLGSSQAQQGYPTGGSVNTQYCNVMPVSATASAKPAARDTILVIDTSSSMGVVSNGATLLSSVQQAAANYINTIQALNNSSVDRIGLVNFDQASKLDVPLTDMNTSPNFATVRNGLSSLHLFSGSGWNTNYELGLKTALDQLQANGRSYANKEIIFMTDGYANLPAPAADYQYSQTAPYTKCSDMVDNSAQVKSLCTKKNGQTVCPVLPNPVIPYSMISAAANQCGIDYTNYMVSAIQAQVNRAAQMGVRITTIRIYNLSLYDSSHEVLQALLLNSTWDPQLLQYMANTTNGDQYSAQYYDATGINTIYSQIGSKLRMRLTS